MFLFDTSAAIAWLRGDGRLKKHVEGGSAAVSVITVYELLWAAKRKSRRATEGVEAFLACCTVLPATADIARRAARFRAELLTAGKDKPMADLLIAATAEADGLPLLTLDNDFRDIARFSDIRLHAL